MFLRIKMHLQFAPKMNDNCEEKVSSFAFENTQNMVIFSVKVIFLERERELFVPVDLSKLNIENLLRETFGGHQEENFCPSLFSTYSEDILRNI